MSLARVQFLSLATKAITTALGITQSIIVVRILSPGEFGLVGLVMSVGGVIGVSQHLGIVDGAIREIAVLRDRREMGKVFWVSHLARQVVTIPLSVGLLLLAGFLADRVYGHPEITLLLQIFSAVLILQGLQDVLGATLTGMKKFVSLYAIQIVTASVNVFIFGWLTWRYGVEGFFWAIIMTTSLMVALLFYVIFRDLGRDLALPSILDIKKYAWRVMRIGAYMYLARIFFIVWQRLPILVLGGVLATDQLGYLNISQTFGSKLTIIAMALSEVNLSWMSSLYSRKREEFVHAVVRNMERVFMIMFGLTMILLFFVPEILQYVIGSEYLPAQQLILVMTVGFFLYALTDIGTSSVFVPADKPKLRAYVYGVMTLISGIVITMLLVWRPDALLASVAILAGALVSYVAMIFVAKSAFDLNLMNGKFLGLLVVLALCLLWLLTDPHLALRFLVFSLLSLYVWRLAVEMRVLPDLNSLRQQVIGDGESLKVICFGGAPYSSSSWTNRQQVMSRVSKKHAVFYVEQRVWLLRFILRHWRSPRMMSSFFKRLLWFEKMSDSLFVKAQWNLVPGSREVSVIAFFNHVLNRWHVLLIAKLLGFRAGKQVMWIYDTEAAEYVSAFKKAKVMYDCVDDHAAQAGVDRNPKRVEMEENKILKRADLVTVTSRKLFDMQKTKNENVQLVLNAGDVDLFVNNSGEIPVELQGLKKPILGSVGALDAYKIDFEMLLEVAREKTEWSFVFIGAPVVDSSGERDVLLRKDLEALPNVNFLGAVDRKLVPDFVNHFDVCLIPYRSSRYNAASFPLKFWEFMATGKPVIVSGLPELRPYSNMIGYVSNAKSFISKATSYLQEEATLSEDRKELALKHTWNNRVEQLLYLINGLL